MLAANVVGGPHHQRLLDTGSAKKISSERWVQIEGGLPDEDLLGAILLGSQDSLLVGSDHKLLLLLLHSGLLLTHHKLLLGPNNHLKMCFETFTHANMSSLI